MKQPDAKQESPASKFCRKLASHADQAEKNADSKTGGASRRILAELRRGSEEKVLAHLYNPAALGTEEAPDEEELEIRILLAVLFAHHRNSSRRPYFNFGKTMRGLAEKGTGDAVERQFLRLIGASKHSFRDVLRQSVRLAAAKQEAINWELLHRDSKKLLFGDDNARKTVIAQWCQGFYSDYQPKSSTSDSFQINVER